MALLTDVVMPLQISGPMAAKFSPIRSANEYTPPRTSGSMVLYTNGIAGVNQLTTGMRPRA